MRRRSLLIGLVIGYFFTSFTACEPPPTPLYSSNKHFHFTLAGVSIYITLTDVERGVVTIVNGNDSTVAVHIQRFDGPIVLNERFVASADTESGPVTGIAINHSIRARVDIYKSLGRGLWDCVATLGRQNCSIERSVTETFTLMSL